MYGDNPVVKENITLTKAGDTILDVLKRGKARLDTMVHPVTGTMMTPIGVATVSPSSHYLPIIMTITVPQWHLPAERTNDIPKMCAGLMYPSRCIRLLDPASAEQDCPYTSNIAAITSKVKNELIEKYMGAVDDQYLSLLYAKVCQLYRSRELCNGTDINSIRDQLERHQRDKRGIIIGTIAILTLIGVVGAAAAAGIGLGTKRDAELKEIQTRIDDVTETLNKASLGLRSLATRTLQINQRVSNITMHVKDQLRTIYTIIERTRCVNHARFKALETTLATHMYRTYLTDTLHHVMQAAITSRLSPSLIGMDELRKALASHPALSNSLIAANPMLAYQFGKVIPVQMDFHNLRFGYLIELPAGTTEHTYPLYQSYSVGFHHLDPEKRNFIAEEDGKPRTNIFHARLPRFAVLRPKVGLVALDHDKCQVGQGITLCRPEAMETHPVKHPCLDMFIGGGRSASMDCIRTASSQRGEVDDFAVLDTPAGTMVRAAGFPVIGFPDLPKRHPDTRGIRLKPSKGAVYFLDFAKFKSFVVNQTHHFTTQGSDLHVTTVVRTPRTMYMPRPMGYDVQLTPQIDLGGTMNFTTLAGRFRDTHPILRLTPARITTFMVAMVLLFVLGAAIIAGIWLFRAGYCCCPQSKARRPVTYKPIQDIEQKIEDQQFHLKTLLVERDLEYVTHEEAKLLQQEFERKLSRVVSSMQGQFNNIRQQMAEAYRAFDPQAYINWHARMAATIIQDDEIHERIPAGTARYLTDLAMPTGLANHIIAGKATFRRPRRPGGRLRVDDSPSTHRSRSPDKKPSTSRALPPNEGATIRVLRTAEPLPSGGGFWSQVPQVCALRMTPKEYEDMKGMAVHNDLGMRQLKGAVGITAGFTVAPAKAMIDTGSDVSYVTPKLAKLLGAKIVPWVEGQYAPVSQADKSPMQLEGWIRGLLCIGGNTYPNVFFVPKVPKTRTLEPFDMLIGNDLLWRIGELNINYATRRLTLRDHNTKFAYSFNLEPTTVDTIIVPSDANQETFWAGGSDPPNQPTTQRHYHRLRTPSTGGTGISDPIVDGRRRRSQSLSPALLPTSPKQANVKNQTFPMASYQTPARNSSVPWQLNDMNTPRSPWTPGGPMSTNRPIQGLPKPFGPPQKDQGATSATRAASTPRSPAVHQPIPKKIAEVSPESDEETAYPSPLSPRMRAATSRRGAASAQPHLHLHHYQQSLTANPKMNTPR